MGVQLYYVYLEDFEKLLSGGKNADALAAPEETGGRGDVGAASAELAMPGTGSSNALFAGFESLQNASLTAADFLSLDSEKTFADTAGGLLAGL